MTSSDWSAAPEKRGLLGMKLMLWCFRLLGRRAFNLLLYPVILVFYCTSPQARRASKEFLTRVAQCRQERGLQPLQEKLTVYRHFYRFGQCLLDKIDSWQGGINLGEEAVFAPGAEEVLNELNTGHVMMISHLGDIELCRALVTRGQIRKVTALVFTGNARRFEAIMKEFAPQSPVNLMALQEVGLDLAVKVDELIKEGQIAAIAADRLAVTRKASAADRVSIVPFMGQDAPFAQGPWILSSLLHCPISAMFALKEQGRTLIYAYKLCDELQLDRRNRSEGLETAIRSYAQILENLALEHPLEWFNFYDFWAPPARSQKLTEDHD